MSLCCSGGKRHGNKGFYVEPTVFSNVKDDMAIATDEIFGPVQQILSFDDLDDVSIRVESCYCEEVGSLLGRDCRAVFLVTVGLHKSSCTCTTLECLVLNVTLACSTQVPAVRS